MQQNVNILQTRGNERSRPLPPPWPVHRQGAGQQEREGKHKEAGQGTGHGGGRGQRPALFEKDRYAGSLPDFAFDVQPPVVQRGYLAA